MKVMVLGSQGMLGSEICRQLAEDQLSAFDSDLDVTDKDLLQSKIQELKPEVIFNCVAYNAVDKAEEDPATAMLLNSTAVGYIAAAAKNTGATLVHFSTGFVFDGENQASYKENDKPNPQSVYAKSKYEGELQAAKAEKYYVVRLNLLFGNPGSSPNSKKSFPELILGLAADKKEFEFVTDEVSTPTYAVDLAKASIALVRGKKPYGIYHLANEGQASWLDFAAEVFKIKGVADIKLNPTTSDKFVRAAKRPKNSVILNTKLPKQRSWQAALKEFLNT